MSRQLRYLTWPVYKSVDETEDKIKSWIAQYDNTEYYNWAIELNDLEQTYRQYFGCEH